MAMALDDRTVQATLTPETRREMLRAFADRMLLKITAMDDPEDMPGVERGVRVAAVIERLYSRCDRAEAHAPDPRKLAAERARHEGDAIKARVELANMLEWGDKRRRQLGPWWEAARAKTEAAKPAPKPAPEDTSTPETPARDASALTAQTTPNVRYVDYTDRIEAARVDLDLPRCAVKPASTSPP
ncbi:hypothetical protein [Asticcacaulis sp. EMRT-3]|uniref:hypothetical protein n=1 Tax=Asticcacaulis sp. EMRT-3 TaxID=3040349 RepID=UPI0024AF777B|nr:hypothetical protein [Asticcacaulis sp. EMRT-3]MDI7776286.1 hypothetical protein [Asticcacaulis sp. EMRT-3]